MVRRRAPRRATTSRRAVLFLAVLFVATVATWTASDWWPDERKPAAGDDVRQPRAGAPRAPLAFDVSPPTAAERGEFGFAMLLVQVLADPRVSSAAGEFARPGMSAQAFRELYEGDPGDGASFLFAPRTPPNDWGVPPGHQDGGTLSAGVSGSAGR
jgi:hypothetical protein